MRIIGSMDAPNIHTRRDWTELFVENSQRERKRREEHTTDIAQSIVAYTLAAEQKLEQVLGGDAGLALLGHRPASAVTTRPRNEPR
jgi:hypothetical protein